MKKILILILLLIPQLSIASVENDINLNRQHKLKVDNSLIKTSTFKVNDMIFHKYFSHTNPFGDSIVDIYKRFNIKWCISGEVLSIGYNGNYLIDTWLNSKTHKSVLLDDNYTKIGCYQRQNITVCHFK